MDDSMRYFCVDIDCELEDMVSMPDFHQRFVVPAEHALANCVAKEFPDKPQYVDLELPFGVNHAERLKHVPGSRLIVAYDIRSNTIITKVDCAVYETGKVAA